MAREVVTGYCWPQSVAFGRAGRSAHVVLGRATGARRGGPRRCAARRRLQSRRGRGRRARDARRTPPRRAADGPPRSRSTSTRRGARATTKSSWRSTSARRCGGTTRSSSCVRLRAHGSCSRWRRTRGTPTTTSADRTSTPAAPQVAMQRPMAAGYLYKPPGKGRRVDGHGRARPAECRARRLHPDQPSVGLRRFGGLARLGAAVHRVGRTRGVRRSASARTPTSRSTPRCWTAPASISRSGTTSTGRAACATPSRRSSGGAETPRSSRATRRCGRCASRATTTTSWSATRASSRTTR